MYRGGGTGTEGCVFVWCLSEDTSVVSGETRLESEDEFPGTVFIRITRQVGQGPANIRMSKDMGVTRPPRFLFCSKKESKAAGRQSRHKGSKMRRKCGK